jgi:SAM-dependent methyltransferase
MTKGLGIDAVRRVVKLGLTLMTPANSYSENWFRFFHAGIAESRTVQEVDFVRAFAPLPGFRKVLDVCCGMGRHARVLSSCGYSVTGIERDAAAIAMARELAGGPSYVQSDVRNYQPDVGAYDAALIMSQSFGYFDDATNRDALRRLGVSVREGGRVILDLWNPEFFLLHQGEREFELSNGTVRERKRVEDGRLFVHLDYPGGGQDDFEWQLFTPAEMRAFADSVGLTLLVSCTDFDEKKEPSLAKPRIQFVLERGVGL